MTTPIIPASPDSDNLKCCCKCHEWKPRSEFSTHKSGKDNLRSECRSCVSTSNLIYRTENREKVLAQKAIYRAEHRAELNEKSAIYKRLKRESQPPKPKKEKQVYVKKRRSADLLKLDRLVCGEIKRKRVPRKTRPASKDFSSSPKRAAREHGKPAKFSKIDALNAIAAFNGCCAVCGRPPGLWHSIALDHWVPVTSPNCPGAVGWNLVPLCHGVGGCNNSKNNRDAEEWLIDKFGKRKGMAILKRIESYLEGCKPAFTEAG